MSVKLIVLYTQPDDREHFEQHYLGTHRLLVDKIPGLQRWESARVVGVLDGGEEIYYRIAELYFDDHDALQAALGSAEGQATASDFRQIAPPGSRLLVASADE